MIQVVSISLQLSGAVILLLWCLKGTSKEQIVRKYFPGSNTVKRDDEDNCVLKKEKLQSITSEVYVNALAFVDLIIGYLSAYFAKDTFIPIVAVALTVLITTILIVGEYVIARKFAAYKYPSDMIIPYSYLEKYDVDTFSTDKEVNDMLNEVFGSNKY